MNAPKTLPLLFLLLATDALAGAPRRSGPSSAVPESPDSPPALDRQVAAERRFWASRIASEECPLFADAAAATMAAAPAPFLARDDEDDDEDEGVPRIAHSNCQSGRHR